MTRLRAVASDECEYGLLVISDGEENEFDFFETRDQAEARADEILMDSDNVAVYVFKILRQGRA